MNVAEEASKVYQKLLDSDQRTMVLSKLMPHLEPEERMSVAQWMHSQGMIVMRTRPLAPGYVAMLPETRIPYRLEPKEIGIEERIKRAVGIGQAKTYRELTEQTGVSGRPLIRAIDRLVEGDILTQTVTACPTDSNHVMHIYTRRTPQERHAIFSPSLRAIHMKIAEIANEIRRGRVRGWEQVVQDLGTGNWKTEHRHNRLPSNLHFDLWEPGRRIAVELKMWRKQEVTKTEAQRFVNKCAAVQPEEAYFYAPKMTREAIILLRENGIKYVKLRRD